MLNALRMAGYLVLGRTHLWQYYTNITWRTCERCLARHGGIVARPQALPDPQDGCERKLLRFPVWELSSYREKARLMRKLAQEELWRRETFREAATLLADRPDEAVRLFDQAGTVDVYIPELERLAEEQQGLLARDPELRGRLREVFLRRWSEKFAKPRYERLPERMRLARERWGEGRIKELFPTG